MEDLTGKQFGPYRIVAALGEGGMAAVYKAYQPAMDRYVALKVLPRHFAGDPQFVARFQREAKVLAKLQHPHILPVHDFGQAEGYTYIVMPNVQTGTLAGLLTGQALPLPQIHALVSQVGTALEYAHGRGLIHRDVKPSNILIDESGNTLLTDFGLARILEGADTLTATGAIMGTPAYMSPEQGLGEKIDQRSDIYSLGVVLYEMATGRVPFEAETPMAVVIKHINDPLPMPRKVNPALPDTVERVILRCLAKSPADRFKSAADLVAKLTEAVAAAPAAAQAGVPQRPAATRVAGRPTPRVGRPLMRTASVIGGVGGLAILGVLAANLLGSRSPKANTDPPTPHFAAAGAQTSLPPADSTESAQPAVPTPTIAATAEGVPPATTGEPSGDMPIRIIDSFGIQADALVGFTWDGENLWFSDIGQNLVIQADRNGNLTGFYPTEAIPLGLGWDGSHYWLFELLTFQFPGELLSRVLFEDGQINRVASLVLTDPALEELAGVIDMEWDGEGMWICDPNQRRVFRIGPAGEVLDSFVYPELVLGIAWDGEQLWLSSEQQDQDGQNLAMVDPRGNVLLSLPSPIPRMETLAWVEGELWALGENDIDGGETMYRLDVSGVRSTLP